MDDDEPLDLSDKVLGGITSWRLFLYRLRFLAIVFVLVLVVALIVHLT